MRIFERVQYLLTATALLQYTKATSISHQRIVNLMLLASIIVGFHKEGMRLAQIPLWATFIVHALVFLLTGWTFTYPLLAVGLIVTLFLWQKFGELDYSKL